VATVLEPDVSAQRPRPRTEVLRRADGVELIGEFEDCGFKEPPKLARRADGQVIQLSGLLYELVHATDGQRDAAAVADEVSARAGRTITPDNVSYLAERKLRPLGVLALQDGTTPKLKKREPVMALRHRRPLLSERAVNFCARFFTWLHDPVVRLFAFVSLVAFDVWLFGIHGIAAGLRSAIYNPTLMLAVFASVIVATMFHEFGHASALRYHRGRPGVMGVGIYLVWPAFYCDVTDAYRLHRKARLHTDLGGVYFNAIFALLAGAVYFATGQEAALLAAFVQHMTILHQLVPLMRFDGYYVLTDLTGVPDILSRVKPILASLVPGRKPDARVTELKPWVRMVVTGYLLLLVPTLAFFLIWMTISLPRLIATFYDSFGLQIDRIQAAAALPEIALGGVNILLLLFPIGGTLVSLSRSGRMIFRGLHKWSTGSAPRRCAAVLAGTAIVGALAYTWWPNGDYQPIRPGERGTIGDAIQALPDVPGGRAAFTPAQELVYAKVPTERRIEAARRAGLDVNDAQIERLAQEDDPGTDWESLIPYQNDGSDGTWYDDGSTTGSGSTTTTDTSTTTTPADTSTTTTPTDTSTTQTTTGTTPAPTDTSTTTTPTDTSTTTTSTTPTTTDTTTTPSTTTDTSTSTAPSTTDTTTTDTSSTPTSSTTDTAPATSLTTTSTGTTTTPTTTDTSSTTTTSP
jgi:putative peptide zinc metalloprotease protein